MTRGHGASIVEDEDIIPQLEGVHRLLGHAHAGVRDAVQQGGDLRGTCQDQARNGTSERETKGKKTHEYGVPKEPELFFVWSLEPYAVQSKEVNRRGAYKLKCLSGSTKTAPLGFSVSHWQ